MKRKESYSDIPSARALEKLDELIGKHNILVAWLHREIGAANVPLLEVEPLIEKEDES